jgi:hypothetical protein
MANGHFLKQFSVPVGIVRASLCAMSINLRRLAQRASIALVACIILAGIIMQIKMGLRNLNFSYAENSSPDAGAGAWIRTHTGKDVVVMARHVPTVSHYSKRKVIWFPPASDANFLMEGIARHKIDFVIVVHREDPYYLPPDDECFAKLLATNGDGFHLEFEAPGFRIFHVTSNSHRSSQYGASALD